MIPLVDMHCHLCAGMDDGPRTQEEALAMCRLAYEDGIRTSAALAHQNEEWSAVTPERIREAVRALARDLQQANMPFNVVPCAEVMVHPDIETAWSNGELLSMADRGEYLLIEMPHSLFVDVLSIVEGLRDGGVRPIMAHAERQPEFLHEPGQIERLIEAGCLVQVNSSSVAEPASSRDASALKDWLRRGVVHVMGSDGHSPRRRRPQMAKAYHQIAAWAGSGVADRVCSTNGTAILHGLPLRIPAPEPRKTRWFARFW